MSFRGGWQSSNSVEGVIMARARSGGLLALGLSLTLFPACDFATGVGDPAKSKQDKDLAGYWVEETSTNVHVLVATARKDGKTYEFEWVTCEGTLADPTKASIGPLVGQLWLTEIGGARFATARFESVPENLAAHVKEKPYVIVKLQHSGDSVTLTKLNGKTDDFAQAKTAADMEAAIKNHVDDAAAYDGTCTLKRSTAEAVKKVRELAGSKAK
jgi:hypothetical protein